jgi:succinate dehydrogenase/fumarate reductase flavoprotein subunit
MSKDEENESVMSRSQFTKENEMAEEKETPRKISRKDFVKGAAALAGAGALVSCGPAATPAPAETPKPCPTCPPAEECPTCPTPWLPEKWDYEADIVVVGYGGGGIGAAIEAVDGGASVLVLEKDPLVRGGNTGCCGGSCNIGSSVDAGIEYLTSECWGTVANAELISDHVEAVHDLPGWIEDLGGKVIWRDTTPSYPLIPGGDKWGGTADEHAGFRIDVDGAEGDGHALYGFFTDAAAAKGISVDDGNVKAASPATALIQDPVTKEILGVKALEGVTFADPPEFTYTGGTEIYVKAKKGVIIACGGYENAEELLRNTAPYPHSAYVTFYGCPYNTGDGIHMATAVGAKLWHLNKKEMHAFACVPLSKELGHGRSVSAYGNQLGESASIIVNRDGNRFMNEYFNSGHSDQHRPFDDFEHKHMPSDDYEYSDYRNVPMYWIFDDTRMKSGSLSRTGQWTGIHQIYEWSDDNVAELQKGYFIQADTIEELGKKIEIKNFFGEVVGMDAAGLVATVEKYNQYCAAGKDGDFGRRASTLIPLSTPPFYAMEVCQCQTNTQGGPEFTKYQQTMGADGEPIPRLYNVGENGSIYGSLYNGGGNCPESYATGRIAAKHALTLDPWDA